MRRQYDFEIKDVKVFATCNEINRLSKPLRSRFRRLHLPQYSREQFPQIAVKVCPKLSEETWEQQGDIRDVISLSKLVNKHDDPGRLLKLLRRWQSMENRDWLEVLVIVVVVMVFLLNSMYVIRGHSVINKKSCKIRR
jgi:hypothetical protein